MSVKEIGNVMDIASTSTRIKANIKKQSNLQPEIAQGDVVSVGNSPGASDAAKIQWPPFFPIGDTQCIFKVEK